MKRDKPQPPPLAMPPELVRYLGQYMNPADLLAAELVTTSDRDTPDKLRESTAPRHEAKKMDIWVSYVPRLHCFSAHREGLGEVRASSLSELCSKLAELQPDVEFSLHLSKVARGEVARRRNGGTPVEIGWT